MYELWEKAGAFNPDSKTVKSNKKGSSPFSIIMPPPNANDPLHIGHAMFITIEDIMIRYHRMKGDDTVWIPGTDHAGIETQYVFEKKLAKDGKSRFNFDRETLFKMIWDYVQENSGVAVDQMKKIGASADWSRFKFTLDKDIVEKVLQTFIKLHKDGLVYRDLQLINYCTKCGTSYSELEVNHVDQTSPLYYVKYRFADNPEEFITVATVRPEPIFVDTHLAVNPKDKTKKHLVGKKVLNPLTNAEMQIIADEYVDPEFGTGIVKLTPAHDPNDFQIAKKLNLPIKMAINTQGKIVADGGKYAGLSVQEARKQVVSDLQEKELIEKIDTKYQNRIGTCYRCGRVIEPLPLPQFFIRVKDKKTNLVENVLKSLDNGETKILGAGREKILRNWLENLKDWNISRQIVWGIKIPVWYEIEGNEEKISVSFLDDSGTYTTGLLRDMLQSNSLETIKKGLQTIVVDASVSFVVSVEPPANENKYIAETDTFDTWFSSSQWPVLTLQTNQADDFDRFYPTTVMETAYDILLFWVMRMMLMGSYLTGKAPFSVVYLHGLVRDQQGKKMSKSKGNVVNPLEIIEEFGADALRMALVIRSTPGLDKSVGEPDFKAARNLSNKIWNAARFVIQMNENASTNRKKADFHVEEKMLILQQEITKNLDQYQLGVAADILYNEFWHWFCDECIEKTKSGEFSPSVILEGLKVFLQLFHPFMPFVTESVWQELYSQKLVSEPHLITTTWPSEIKTSL
ncbi:MAG: valyl-tRNA synthetase [Patescibacteria group bacterium]|nr:valyl-tRNA synthetase [Patescibacteria group bacterium]